MNSRERVLAAGRIEEVDRKPTLAWMADQMPADAVVVAQAACAPRTDDSPVFLADVANPFGLALQKGIDLNKALKDDPTVGGDILDGLVDEVRKQISIGLQSGADGIFYRLHGACPKHCSPMQYGGHYLERDRELLVEASSATFNVLFVAGPEELYIDFVSDLPAHVFAWDSEMTRVSADDVRGSRTGAVASSDPTSEIVLLIGRENYLENLEQPNIG
jgi:hypothetical protein